MSTKIEFEMSEPFTFEEIALNKWILFDDYSILLKVGNNCALRLHSSLPCKVLVADSLTGFLDCNLIVSVGDATISVNSN